MTKVREDIESVESASANGQCYIQLYPRRTSMAKSSRPGKAEPNILILWGDDIGQSNLSVFTKGMMGYKTPNIDRVANEGMLFTDYYAEQSCTAGRAAFMYGQSV